MGQLLDAPVRQRECQGEKMMRSKILWALGFMALGASVMTLLDTRAVFPQRAESQAAGLLIGPGEAAGLFTHYELTEPRAEARGEDRS